MTDASPGPSPGSDFEFELAQRAVERGLLRVEQVEAAILQREREPGKALLDLLPLAAGQIQELRGAHRRPVPPEAAAALLDPARRVGHYVRVAPVSEGGMGEVWRGWDTRLSRWVALKFPKRGDERARAYFAREAALAAALDHPGIARVYEVGEWEGSPFLAMQFIEGRTLDRAARGASREQLVRWTRDVALAVHAAHRAGVMHRDLKPSNVMVDGEGRAIVLDFGLAKETDVDGQTLGLTQFVVGTPGYMAPETARGKSDPQSDVYGIGAILYELLTGKPPFVGATATEVMVQVLEREPVWPRKVAPGVPRDLEAVVLHGLEKDRRRRYASAAELAEDLNAFLDHQPLRHARRPTAAYVLGKKIRRQPLLWTLGAAAVALALALSGVWARWFFERGTLVVRVEPAGARVRCGGSAWTSTRDAHALRLPKGAWEVSAEADGCEPAATAVLVDRGGSRDVTLALRRHHGRLEATAEPGDAVIEVSGRRLGSIVVMPEAETGRYDLLAWAPGCFEQRRTLEVRRGESSVATFGLDCGQLWRYPSARIQAGTPVLVLPDLDGDGEFDLAISELTEVALISGAGGTVIDRIDVADDPNWRLDLLDLGGPTGRVLAAASQRKDRLTLTLVDLRPGASNRRLRDWSGPRSGVPRPCTACFLAGPDTDGDGTAEVAVAGIGHDIYLVDPLRDRHTAVNAGLEGTFLFLSLSLLDPSDRTRLHFSATRRLPGSQAPFAPAAQGELRLPAGEVLWISHEIEGEGFAQRDLDGDGVAEALLLSPGRIDARTSRTGEPLPPWNLPEFDMGSAFLVDLDGDRRLDAVGMPPGKARAATQDGRVLWETPLPAGSRLHVRPGEPVLALCPDRLEALDARTGRRLWSSAGALENAWSGDVDGDGALEVLSGVTGVGIRCHGADGALKWTLRTRGDAAPIALVDGPDERRLVFGRGGSFVAFARTPRVLWHVSSNGPFLADPVAIRLADGRTAVVQCGDWGGGVSVRAFDGATGVPLWRFAENVPPNRAPAVARGPEGRPAVLAFAEISTREPESKQSFVWLDAADGRLLARWTVGPPGDHYATPVAADLDGDGRLDAAQARRSTRDVIAAGGAAGGRLWRAELPGASWGGAAAADLDGDGRVELVVPVAEGPVVALRGSDGTEFWRAPAGEEGVAGIPTVADVMDGPETEVLVLGGDGRLRVLHGATGRELASFACADAKDASKTGSAAPGLTKDVALIVVPAGAGGLVAFAGRPPAELWRGGPAVDATPLVADLDGDGATELCAGTRDGRLIVLDARTGRPLWSERLGAQPVTASVSAADLDGDGILDLLVADREGRLSAISGRPTRAARRR